MPESKHDKTPEEPKGQSWLHRLRARLRRLLDQDVRELTRVEKRLRYLLKLMAETWREVALDLCQLRAAALAYKTLLSLVPLLAVVMAILASENFAEHRERLLDWTVDMIYPVRDDVLPAPPGPGQFGADAGSPQEQPPVEDPQAAAAAADADASLREIKTSTRQQIREWIQRFTTNANEVGLFGFAVLIFFFVWTLRTVELAFDAIWNVHEGRPMSTQIARYSAILLWGPILVLVSISLTQYIHTATVLEVGPRWLRSWILAYVLPYIITSAAFLTMYFWIPNVRVRVRSGLAGAAVGAFMFELAKHGFQFYVANVPSYSKVYGTLSVLPVMLLWFYISWLVILFGAEVSFVIQNFEDLTRKQDLIERASRWRTFYGVTSLVAIGESFLEGQSPPTVHDLAVRFNLPEYVIQDILGHLRDQSLLERTIADDQTVYLPRRDLGTLTVADAVGAINGHALEPPGDLANDPVATRIAAIFTGANSAADAKMDVTLRELARETAEEAEASGAHSSDETRESSPPSE